MNLPGVLSGILSLPSPLEMITTSKTKAAKIKLFVKRDDLIHPLICGNKWRKLKYAILKMHAADNKGIITFGGAYSNHLIAVAAAGHYGQFDTVGIVRSYQEKLENPTLDQCKALGMHLYFMHPKKFQEEEQSYDARKIFARHEDLLYGPMGGCNEGALEGVGEMYQEVISQLGVAPDYCITAIGTGATLAGIINEARDDVKIIGMSPFKAKIEDLDGLQYINETKSNFKIERSAMPSLRFGGYSAELVEYINSFKSDYNIQLDPIYTGRAMMRLECMCEEGLLREGTSVVFIHTGGLQGIAGYNHQYAKKKLLINAC